MMIRFRPERSTLSASLKDERVFPSLDDMLLFILDAGRKRAAYTGTAPITQQDVSLVSCNPDNRLNLYRNERMIMIRRTFCVGYCGE